MREIKYRAFIKTSKKIIDVEWIDFKNKQITYNSIDFSGFGLVDQSSFEDIELIEFTGLKDKNGLEIYEGDVLIYWGFTFVISYQDAAFGWTEGGEFHSFSSMAISEISKTKVIGNIYENPELLEGSSA